MSKVDEKVMAAVEAALKKDPKASVGDLYEMAKGVSSGIGRLSKRQFHARYPLQIKRKMKPSRAKKRRAAKKPAKRGRKATAAAMSPRDSVRGIMLKFAADLAAAEARKDAVRVVAGVDRYVDDILAAAGTGK